MSPLRTVVGAAPRCRYCHRVGGNVTPCGFTSFLPIANDMVSNAQLQSVAGFVAQDSSESAITYVGYSYARNADFPVTKALHKAHYYLELPAGSVAVALLQTKWHQDLTQDLSQVYVDTDPRTYPLSSYSYMIAPRDTTVNFNPDKGRSLSEFVAYPLCEGQQRADLLGYSSLPVTLVQAGVDQTNQLRGATHRLDPGNLAHCNNPMVSPDGANLVARNAPQPQASDLHGPIQCVTGTGGARGPTQTNASGPARGGGLAGGGESADSGGSSGTDGNNSATGGDTGTLAEETTPEGAAATTIDPVTGQVIGDGTSVGGPGSGGVTAVPVTIDPVDSHPQMVLEYLAAVSFLVLVLELPLVGHIMRKRAGPQRGPLP